MSKFFYGGYALETISGMSPHNHSRAARNVVNSLVVGQIVREAPEFICRIVNKTKVNDFTLTVTFRATKKISGLRLFHSDITMLGKHYLVKKMTNP